MLGNLPRERPGTRSAKRSGDTRPRAPADRPPPTAADGGHDPVGEAIRAAGKAAETGLRVANGVTREVLRRLPRPR